MKITQVEIFELFLYYLINMSESEDIELIQNIDDYNRIKQLRPVNKYKYKKYGFICTKCGKYAIKRLLSITLPLVCHNCNIKTAVNDEEYIEKRRQTLIQKYGTDNQWKNKTVQKKRKQTWIKKYGTDNPQKATVIRTNRNITEQNNLIEKYNNIIDEHIISYDYKEYTCKCNVCNNIFKIDKDLFYNRVITHKTTVCTICNPISNTGSGKQLQLNEYIKTIYNGTINYNVTSVLKNNKELDIYLPDLKLAFEFDGTYWHADSRFYEPDDIIEHKKITAKEIWERDKQKDLMCEQLGITLMRVKEYDWIHNQESIKNKIKDIIEKSRLNIQKQVYN